MPATCHRVVGIVDVEENPEFMLQLDAPLGPTVFSDSHSNPKFFTTAKLTVEIEQLAADLKIEYQRFQRAQRQALSCT